MAKCPAGIPIREFPYRVTVPFNVSDVEWIYQNIGSTRANHGYMSIILNNLNLTQTDDITKTVWTFKPVSSFRKIRYCFKKREDLFKFTINRA